MRDWRETVAPGAPTVKLDVSSRRGQKNSLHTGTSTMQHQGYCRALPAANLRRLIFLRSLVFSMFRDFYLLMKLRTTILLYKSSKDVSTCSSRDDLAYTPISRGTPPQMSARDVDAARLPNFFWLKLHFTARGRHGKMRERMPIYWSCREIFSPLPFLSAGNRNFSCAIGAKP